MEGQATIHINAAPEVVWALVTDVTRMGEWSPETTAAEWVDGATGPAVGAKFRGTNKVWFYKWSTTPVITACESNRLFAFDAGGTIWTYSFTESDGGTSVTESFRVESRLDIVYTIAQRRGALIKGMQKTLERLKAAAESQP
ncbi:MAG TPA: SRPBCC family protein [Acidimicrobiales bacterium]|nr:SRPBCC family protein [Acidimicrobiales bacterium]